jgi:trk system potassium uptake protein TrkA
MNVIIMGCGRVGEQLARLMADEGHAVTVIDYALEAFERLGPDFKGRLVLGVGFDRDILIKAGIEQAEAFAATSSSDNANIIAAQIARRIFRVPRVVARVYNPRQVEIYQRLGLVTISSTTWGAERIHELLTHSDLDAVMSFGSGEVSLVAIEAPPRLVGRVAKDITVAGEISVVAVVREGKALLPTLGTEFRARDVVHLAVLASAMERVEALLGQ